MNSKNTDQCDKYVETVLHTTASDSLQQEIDEDLKKDTEELSIASLKKISTTDEQLSSTE